MGAQIIDSAPAAAVVDASAGTAADAPPTHRQLKRRLLMTGLLGAFAASLLLAVPELHPVLDQITDMDPAWIALAIALELASCVSFEVLFRLFFDRVAPSDARLLAWTSMASGALLPGGGVGGLAIGGWLMHQTGADTKWIVRRASAIFFFTTAVNAAAIIGSAALLLAGVGGPANFLHAGLPLLLVAPATLAVAAVPMLARPDGWLRRSRWTGSIVQGIGDAEASLAWASWRLLGAIGYLFFDIAVLWAAFAALGHAPPIPALIIGYTIGYLANALPVPGGIGVLDAGLAGALVLYGVSPVHAAAAVLVYHAIAFWVPSAGGVIAYGRLGLRLSADHGQVDPAIQAASVHPPAPECRGERPRQSQGRAALRPAPELGRRQTVLAAAAVPVASRNDDAGG